MKTKVVGIIILSVVLALSAGPAFPAAAEDLKKEYKLTLNVPSSFYWGMGATKFAELVLEKTNGRINVKPYFSSTLLKGAQLHSPQMVAKGIIDCAFESTINSSTVIPEMNLFSLPFFINNFEKLDKIENGAAGQALFASLEKIGLKGLAWGENGFRQLTNSKGPASRPEDIKGLRVRVVGSPIFVDIFRELGADPVNMNWGDAVTAFQQGVVDGQENPVGVLIPIQIFQYHKYAFFWNYVVDPLIFYWNKAQWDAFPPEIQAAIQESANQAARFQKALARAGLDGDVSLNILKEEFNYDIKVPEPIEFLESKGMTITTLTEEEVNEFKTRLKPVYDRWVPQIGKELYKKAQSDMNK
ncbi:MAG: DctP family TRAP transporter solute-binding subunit [Pseudomonadota bacterium]